MLEIKNLGLTLTDDQNQPHEILNNINLTLEKGKLYGITGPNGGGKTSLAKVIMGIYHHTAGEIILNGEKIDDLSVDERAIKGISYAFQQPPRFKGITIEEILGMAAGTKDREKISAMLENVGLEPQEYLERCLGAELSGGEMKRIEIAEILLRNTPVNLFDEPEAGVDLWTVQRLTKLLIDGYREQKDKITFIISHNEKMLKICDELIVLDQGQIEKMGPTEEIWEEIRIREEAKMTRNRQGGVLHELN